MPRAADAPDLEFETALWSGGLTRVAGLDEAGRGALAGPVFVAALVLPADPAVVRTLEGVRDSKQMTARQRERAAERIRARALAWAIGRADAAEIDALGIAAACRLAAERAVADLPFPPDYILADYRLQPDLPVSQTALVKGDRRSLTVAGASVLAKTARDEHVRALDRLHPGYGLARHKGYGTLAHREAIRALGPCAEHRRSFRVK